MASDEEIAGRVDMADTPLGSAAGPPAPPATRSADGGLAGGLRASGVGGITGGLAPSALAEALWELLPAAAGSAATPRAAAAARAAAGDGEAQLPAAAPAAGAPEAAAAAGSPEPRMPAGPCRPPLSPPPGLGARLGCLLRRLLAAAGASGSSVPQLMAGHRLPLSRSPSLDSLYATPHGSSSDLFEGACSESDEPLTPPLGKP